MLVAIRAIAAAFGSFAAKLQDSAQTSTNS
jgi:hypothetical protein